MSFPFRVNRVKFVHESSPLMNNSRRVVTKTALKRAHGFFISSLILITSRTKGFALCVAGYITFRQYTEHRRIENYWRGLKTLLICQQQAPSREWECVYFQGCHDIDTLDCVASNEKGKERNQGSIKFVLCMWLGNILRWLFHLNRALSFSILFFSKIFTLRLVLAV